MQKHFKEEDGTARCGATGTWEIAKNLGESCPDCRAITMRRAVSKLKVPGFNIKFGGVIEDVKELES